MRIARWIHGEVTDPRYHSLEKNLREAKTISISTLRIQGGSDYCDDPKESERQESFFTGGYIRLVLDGIGHFPHREASAGTAKAIADFFK
jgi:pimeloyl-ACP methyl ester carboxylesterase